MRKIYIAVTAVLLVSITLFALSFAYLDKSKRRTYTFTVSFEGRDIGTIKVDKFITEEKLIYKSAADIPFAPLYTAIRSRLDLSKRYTLESYEKEMTAGRATDSLFIRNAGGLLSFVSKYQAGFSFADNIPEKRDTFIFEEESPVTYLPIIENYDFSKGRSQVFNILTPQEPLGLPPMKRLLTLTSIKDEYLKIDSRKIKTENLILKMRIYPQMAVWVAKSDRAIIKIELPDRKITITRSFRPKTVRAAPYSPQDPRYLSKEAVFKSRGAELSGTLTMPTREGRFPAVLLVPGAAPDDRNLEGLFSSIADYLSKNGISVLRYDKRGIGASKGDAAIATDSEESQDAMAALEYLKGLDTVDPGKVAIASYGKGALHALTLVSKYKNIAALILIAPELCVYHDFGNSKNTAAATQWSDDYAALVRRTAEATAEKVKNAKGSWSGILGIRCYMNEMREETCAMPISLIEQIKIPVLILQRQKGKGQDSDTASALNKAFADTGNADCTLVALRDPGKFFGNPVHDGTHRLYYKTDEKALDGIGSWLEKSFAGSAAPQETAPHPAPPAEERPVKLD